MIISGNSRALARGSRSVVAALVALLLLSGCPYLDLDDDDTIGDCPDGQLYVAEACDDEEYCGDATVRVGTGGTSFESLEEGQDVPIWYGSQGGYHVFYSVEMENLCPVVFVRISMLLDPGDGELVLIHEQERHVQAVRLQPGSSSLQSYWGVNGFLPCEYWPEDPEHGVSCPEGAGSVGHLENYEVVMQVEAEDHNGRLAIDQKRVQPVCCSN